MIYAHTRPATQPVPVTAERLHQHADAIDHAAAVGGWVDAAGERHTLTAAQRRRWAADAAMLREHAHTMEAAL